MKIQKLEAIRGLAAIYVVFHHFIGYSILRSSLPAIVRFPFRFGQEAVILFFLLSGFVIYISSHNRNKLTFKKYFLKRFVRIYPILLISYILSFLISLSNNHVFAFADFKELIGNFFMLQDTTNKPGIHVLPFMHNDPLWSLSYEWWFYMMFFPLFILRERFKSHNFIYPILFLSLIGWIAYMIYPDHLLLVLSYFVIWWSGLECADIYIHQKNFTFSNLFHVLLALFIMLCFSTIPIINEWYNGIRKFSQIEYPIITFRHYLFSFVVILVGLLWWKLKLRYFDKLFSYFERFSAVSYAIYIIHFPFLWLKIPYVGNPYIAIVIKLIAIFIMAYILEIKVQPLITNFFFKRDKKPA